MLGSVAGQTSFGAQVHPSVECIPLTIALTFFMKKKDDYKKFYKQCGKYHRSKLGDEQISFKEYVDCMKEGQKNIDCITGESIAAQGRP